MTFGIVDNSTSVLVAVLNDEKGDKLTKIAKKIKGKPVKIDNLKNISNYDMIKKVPYSFIITYWNAIFMSSKFNLVSLIHHINPVYP